MTPQQSKAKERLKSEMMRMRGGEKFVVKREETETEMGQVFYLLEIGMKDDEGTAAAIFCRYHCHAMIGPRGGVSCLNSRRKGILNTVWGEVTERVAREKREARKQNGA